MLPFIVCLWQSSYAGNTRFNTAAAADTVTGVVVDDYSHGLAGVTIKVKETPGVFATSNRDGVFSISAKAGNTLLFSLKNYNTYTCKVTGKNLSVQMLNSYLQQPDTIDVLYGRIAAENNLGSVATIYTNQVTTTPATIFPYALAGRLTGLRANQYSGYRSVNTSNAIKQAGLLFTGPASFGANAAKDNSEISLNLRGQTPITIIDGVQREFSSLDFEDIESISVLKDALSTILLGQVSSNGILLVTTKKPQPGTPRISFTAQTGYQEPLKLLTPLPAYQYAYLYNEALQNGGNQPAYTAEDFQKYRYGSDPIGHPNIDWYDEILRKSSPITKYNFTLNGGNETASYMVSLGYLNQQGLLKDYSLESYNTNAELSRYTINSNINVNVTKNFNVALQIFGRIQSGNQPGATTSSILGSIYNTPNNAYPIYNPDGSFGGSNDYTSNLFAQLTRSGYMVDYARDIMVNVDLTYKFDNWVKGLWAKAKGNLTTGYTSLTDRSKSSAVFEMLTSNGDTTYNRYGTPADQANNYALTTNSQIWYAQLSTGIDKQYGKNHAGLMLMADQRAVTVNFDLPGTYSNLAGKASYNYDNKYFAEGALTYSGCDRYQPGNRFGWFYAGGLGWKVSEESFIKDNVNWINLLKLRGTYGKTGNANIGYFTYRPSFTSGNSYNFGASNPASVSGMEEATTLTTNDATWEKANKLDIGFDLNVLHNSLQFTFDYYHDRYYDLMQQRGSSTVIIGESYPSENIGINAYYGTEFSATYQNHFNDFNYFITGNVSLAQSKIIYQDEIQRKYAANRRTGQPVDRPFGYIVTGIIQTTQEAAAAPVFDGYTLRPGDLKYVDINGDGKITQQYDMVPIGTNKPHLFYGTTLGFNYKGFDFSVLLQGEGNRILNVSYSMNNLTQAYTPLLNRWTPSTAATATLPRLTLGYNVANSTSFGISNTFYQHNGNYLRVKNVDVGYNLPYNLIKHLGISGLRVFANALNLFTVSGYDLIDPEVSGGAYPIQRVFNTGVTVKL